MKKDIFKIPSYVLFGIGLIDLLRGFMHTYYLTWAATNIAKLDLSAGGQQLFLLGVFGMSNWVTGLIYLIVSIKAREISPYILITIPLAYGIGLFGIRMDGVKASAEFNGQYFMYVYFAVCIITFVIFCLQKKSRNN